MEGENCMGENVDESNAIRAIDRGTVHRICSGQVVLTLGIAVKELIENAIDAGATIINIDLKEYGSELIEVSDNGPGVAKEFFQALTLKHHTSKITQFNDLESISTLGFRGEALSSLCALCDLVITTKHKSAENATKLLYDRNGMITDETICAREQGTTVSLKNLFLTLPVRRREFLKNLKREFSKMCQLLYAYCLVTKDVKFRCTNQTKSGSKNVIVATQGLNSVKDNIINIFGAKQISSLIEIDLTKPEQDVCEEFSIQFSDDEELPFSCEFFVSSVTHGSGRHSADRQFYYINSRPCEPIKITKLVNQIYKQYNSSQYPFVYLNVICKSCLVDVNVTPDKRQVFMEKEKQLLAALKASMIKNFKDFPSTFQTQNMDVTKNLTVTDFFDRKDNVKGLKRSLTDSGYKKGSILERFGKRSKTENDKGRSRKSSLKNVEDSFELSEADSDQKLTEFLDISYKIIASEKTEENINQDNEETDERSPVTHIEEFKIICSQYKSHNKEKLVDISEVLPSNESNLKSPAENTSNKDDSENSISSSKSVINSSTLEEDTKETSNENFEKIKDLLLKQHKGKIKLGSYIKDKELDITVDEAPEQTPLRKTIHVDFSLEDIRDSIQSKLESSQKTDDVLDDVKVRFRSEIKPESNKLAEEELNKQIKKSDFQDMAVVGQFNLGFIIANLRNDLFIIDQHATDEKYNFELLQKNMVLGNQTLVNPKPLELTAGNETLLIENEKVFNDSGFTFHIDHSAPCTQKVSLTAVPLSKNFIFGKDDIDEMLLMLQYGNTTCRPSRIRSMFASRACRKSVMIGMALSKSDMRKLIDHMGEIDQPWNCPHGRPTMRHLVNLNLLDKQ